MKRSALIVVAMVACAVAAWWAPAQQAVQTKPAAQQKTAAKTESIRLFIPELRPRKEDFPAMAVDAVGTVWATWLLNTEGKDGIEVARLRPPTAGEDWERDRVWAVELPSDAAVGELTLAAGHAGVWLAVTIEAGRRWDLYVCPITASGPGRLIPVTHDAASNAKPSASVSSDGRLWLAWESRPDGDRAIYVASAGADGKYTAAERISPQGSNAYNPHILALDNRVAIAYDSFRDSNSDIYLRVRDAKGWQPERRLTTSPLLDRHPILTADSNGALWMAWQVQGFDTTLYRFADMTLQTVRVARIDASGLRAPLGMDDGRFSEWLSRPSMAFDPAGRLWLSARAALGKNGGWETIYYCYSGGAWSDRLPLNRFQGRVRAVPMLFSGGRLVAAEQRDSMLRTRLNPPRPAWYSNIAFTGLELARVPKALPLQVETYREPRTAPGGYSNAPGTPHQEFQLKAARRQRAEDGPHHAIDYQGRRLNLYWGDFHEHSNVSVCVRRGNPPPEDLYPNLRDIANLDFAGITDHGYDFDAYFWNWNGKYARINQQPGRFVTFQAQEWTSQSVPPESPGGQKRYGHRNLIYSDAFFGRWFNAFNDGTPAQLWQALAGVDFVTIPHQLADTTCAPTDWKYVDESLQPVAEIYQGRGSYECLDAPRPARRAMGEKGHFIQDAWARGVIIGVIASPDHGGGAGKAAVYADKLDRDSILSAIRARHTYGTTGARISLEVRVNGRLMGDKLPAPPAGQPVEVAVKVVGAGDLEAVEVCRNNQFVYKKKGQGGQMQFVFRDTAPPRGRLWYYVRVTQTDGELAWSSPVWLGN